MNKANYKEIFQKLPVGQEIYNWRILDNELITKGKNLFVKCLCVKCNGFISDVKASNLINGDIQQCKHCTLKEQGKSTHLTYKGIINTIFRKIAEGARKRNIQFDITIYDIGDLFEKQNGKCALTGIPLKLKKTYNDKNSTASLDRKDNTKGYLKDNIQWVYRPVNFMKGTLTEKDFFYLCSKVINNKK